jgi:hypothetical protein
MKRIVFVSLALLLLLVPPGAAMGMDSASYRLEPDVLSGGGGLSTSASYRMEGTFGQPSPAGLSMSASYRMFSGFWYQLAELIAGGDVNGDGQIDLQDAVLALQIVASFSTTNVHNSADIDGDQTIGVQEAFYVLQKIAALR